MPFMPNSMLVDHPPHCNSNPSGIECIDVVEHLSFNIGNAIKYLWRCEAKWNTKQDLEKAKWYIDREIARLDKLWASCARPITLASQDHELGPASPGRVPSYPAGPAGSENLEKHSP